MYMKFVRRSLELTEFLNCYVCKNKQSSFETVVLHFFHKVHKVDTQWEDSVCMVHLWNYLTSQLNLVLGICTENCKVILILRHIGPV